MTVWRVSFLNDVVISELDAQPADIRAKFLRIVALIESRGLTEIHEPHVKYLGDRIWEMRMSGRDGIARALYITAVGKRVVVLRVFSKKTEKTPHREIELALIRAKEVQ